MPSLREHLESPQFTDENGEPTGEAVIGRVGGSWVKPGVPRSRGYLFYAIVFFGGLFLFVTGSGLDIIALFGIICLVVGVVGALEVARGRPFSGFRTLAPGGRGVSQALSIDVRAWRMPDDATHEALHHRLVDPPGGRAGRSCLIILTRFGQGSAMRSQRICHVDGICPSIRQA